MSCEECGMCDGHTMFCYTGKRCACKTNEMIGRAFAPRATAPSELRNVQGDAIPYIEGREVAEIPTRDLQDYTRNGWDFVIAIAGSSMVLVSRPRQSDDRERAEKAEYALKLANDALKQQQISHAATIKDLLGRWRDGYTKIEADLGRVRRAIGDDRYFEIVNGKARDEKRNTNNPAVDLPPGWHTVGGHIKVQK